MSQDSDREYTDTIRPVKNGDGYQGNSKNELHQQQNEMTFEKRTVPKQRTQSMQSVLSHVSLKSLNAQANAHYNHNSTNRKQHASQQPAQSQFKCLETNIQAPAFGVSSKKKASFEIGQKLPFSKDNVQKEEKEESSNNDGATNSGDSITEVTEAQKKLTDDALKRLSSFSKFQPAEVDYSIQTVNNNPPPAPPPQQSQSQSQSQSAQPVLSINKSAPTTNQKGTTLAADYPRSNQIQPRSRDLRPPPMSSFQKRSILNSSSTAQDRNHLHPQTNIGSTPSSQNSNTVKSLGQIVPSSPPNSTRTVTDQSSENSLQTLTDLRRPMYVPAVLRQSNTNLKEEDLRYINELNSRKAKSLITNAAASLRSQTSHWKLSFEASSTNLPTRAHWRRDLSRNSCAFCETTFTFFERRHHCRRCGDIFCANHTSHLLKLGLDAQFTVGGSGVLCKVCDNCCKDYEEFVKNKFGNNGGGALGNGSKTSSGSNQNDNGRAVNSVENLNASTVPADWSWSSF